MGHVAVRDSSRGPAHPLPRSRASGLALGFFLRLDLLGDVVDDAEARRSAGKLEVKRDHLHVDKLAAFLAVAPDALPVVGAVVFESLAQASDVFLRADLVGGQ